MVLRELYKLGVLCDIKHWGAVGFSEHEKWGRIGQIVKGMIDGYMEVCVIPFSDSRDISVGVGFVDSGEDVMEIVDSIADDLVREKEGKNDGVSSYIDGMIGELNRVVYLIGL